MPLPTLGVAIEQLLCKDALDQLAGAVRPFHEQPILGDVCHCRQSRAHVIPRFPDKKGDDS
jgi:hypothetical protein